MTNTNPAFGAIQAGFVVLGAHPSTGTRESMNVDEMNDDELEAAQAAEDAANGNLEVKDEEEETVKEPESEAPAAVAQEPTETEPQQAAEAEPAQEATPETQPKVAGVASKDGTRVLPYAALQAERRAARHERSARERAEQEAAALRQQLEDLKSGKTASESTDELSDEELAQLADDIPQVAKVAKQVKALQEKLSKLTPAKSEPEPSEPETTADDTIQEAIDAVPMLLEWQASDPEKFARAQAIDEVAKASPKWRGKPLHERFEYVAKQVAEEFDIPTEQPPRTAPPPSKDKAEKAISTAARTVPNTLSDFKGGAADQTEARIDKMPPARALARMQQMSDEEIEAHLAKFG